MDMAKMDMAKIGECSTWLSITGQLFATRMGKLLEPHGLTLGQFSVLHHICGRRIDAEGGERIGDIAAAVEIHQPAVTKAVAKFETLGLVALAEDPKDRRARRVVATDKGRERLNAIRRDMGPDLARALGRYAPEDLERFTAMLRDLGRWLDGNRL